MGSLLMGCVPTLFCFVLQARAVCMLAGHSTSEQHPQNSTVPLQNRFYHQDFFLNEMVTISPRGLCVWFLPCWNGKRSPFPSVREGSRGDPGGGHTAVLRDRTMFATHSSCSFAVWKQTTTAHSKVTDLGVGYEAWSGCSSSRKGINL